MSWKTGLFEGFDAVMMIKVLAAAALARDIGAQETLIF
jgi:hypothetical protein